MAGLTQTHSLKTALVTSMTDSFRAVPRSILHIGKFYPPHSGGMETYMRNLAVRQLTMGPVSVVVANSLCRREHALIEGVSVTRVARMTTVASMPVCPGLTRAIRSHPADLVHLHMPNPGAAFSFLMSGHRGKLIITHHADTLGRKYLRTLSDPFVRSAMERASAVIVTSRRYLDSSEELKPFRDKCRVIPIGIDERALCDLDEASVAGIPAEPARPYVLAVGRLVPYKGFDVLIRAMKQVDAVLLLIGTGPQAAELHALVKSEGLQQRVEMLGRVDDLRRYYQKASLFVLPSITRAEAFGIVQLEAMAAGLPVINTNLQSGVPEVSVDGETGLTVEPGDMGALGRAIKFLLENPDLREKFGKAAKAAVKSEFTADLMAQRAVSLYREALESVG